MRFGHTLLFLTAFTLTYAAVPAKKAAPKPATQPKTTARKSPGKAVTKTGRQTASRKGAKTLPRTSGFRSRQMQPTPDRYREIQQALADKGYLKSEPSGVWGAESIDALKQFQLERNIPVTGKLNSRSIIGLGLGPKPPEGPLMVPPPAPDAVRP